MAEENDHKTEGGEGGTTAPDPEDLEAKYKKLLAESRRWEERAKANKAAADELERLKEDGKSVEDKVAELTAKLEAKEAAERHAKDAAEVAKAKGVPADLLSGSTREEMEAWADRLAAAMKTKPAPRADKPGAFDNGAKDKNAERLAFVNQLFGKN